MFQTYPLISIVINNYNYGRFLDEAIKSALDQTYPAVEIIVVDDGSTDESRTVIAKYHGRVQACLKENGGQGSALNEGFKLCNGEVVIFVDADDVLHRETAERIAIAHRDTHGAAKFQYKLQKIDYNGNFLEDADIYHWQNGDFQEETLRLQYFWWPPTSANAFSSAALKKIMPIPEETFRICADIYLNNMILMCGVVYSLDFIGVFYRIHGSNNYSEENAHSSINLPSLKRHLAFHECLHKSLIEYVHKHLPDRINSVEHYDVSALRAEMALLRLDNTMPKTTTRVAKICLEGIMASLESLRLTGLGKTLSCCWFLAMLVSPKALAYKVAEFFYGRNMSTRIINTLTN